MTDTPRDCQHGQLARSCERCADAAEIRELREEVAVLRAEAEYEERSREQMRHILAAVAVALKGPEPPNAMWGWADLPDLAQALRARLNDLQIGMDFMERSRDP